MRYQWKRLSRKGKLKDLPRAWSEPRGKYVDFDHQFDSPDLAELALYGWRKEFDHLGDLVLVLVLVSVSLRQQCDNHS